MKEYFVEFKIGTTITLSDDYDEDELIEKIDEAQRELRLTDYDNYILTDEEGKVVYDA